MTTSRDGRLPRPARLIALCLALGVASATARPDPVAVIRAATERVLAAVEREGETLAADRGRAVALTEDLILPHVDTHYVARAILGQHWRMASAAQRQAFIDAFTRYLAHRYAGALVDAYDGQSIRYRPFRAPDAADHGVVRAEIVLADGPSIHVGYRVYLTADERWLIYDVTVEGISLVASYRHVVTAEVRETGLDALISRLRDEAPEAPNP